MKVYNTNYLRGNQRFMMAILAGVLSSIACAIVYGIIVNVLHFNTSLFYIAMGYGISYCIKTFGRGVEVKYSVLGAVCTLFAILLGSVFVILFSIGLHIMYLPAAFVSVLYCLVQIELYTIIEWICIAYSMYVAYYNARII